MMELAGLAMALAALALNWANPPERPNYFIAGMCATVSLFWLILLIVGWVSA